MKIACSLLLIASTSAFAPSRLAASRLSSSTSLQNARVDSSEAVKAALEASKKYGATSKEARVAWDIVEELDASDNRAAFEGGVSAEECVNIDSNSPECKAYDRKIAQLAKAVEEQKAQVEKTRRLAEEIRQLKLVQPDAGTKSADTPQMRAALAEAKKATNEHGADSTEAKLAWETVEEIAGADLSEAMKGSLEDECLIETIEACEALEELQSVLAKVNSA